MDKETQPPPEQPSDTQPASSDAWVADETGSFADILLDADEKRSRGIPWILGAGAVFLLGLGGVWAYRTFTHKAVVPIAVTTAPVKKADIALTITEVGIVELGGQQTFKAPSDITVQEVRVKERQQVAAGTVLLVLRNRRLQQELQDQQLENQIANNSLNRKREIVQEQQAKVREAQKRLADSQALLQRGFISEDEFRGDRTQYNDALSALKTAQVDLNNAELTARNNQLKTQSLQVQLADNQLRSPMDAVVLEVEVKPGDGVEPGVRLLTIGDPAQETVRLYLTTLNAAKVRTNMPLSVSMVGPNPKVFPGRIARVSPQAVIHSSGGSANEQARVEAEAVLDQPSRGVLIPGSPVSVEIILEQRRNVIVIPLTALQTEAQKPFVWIRSDDGTAQQRPVQVGLRNIQSVEITRGLQPGDEIVTEVPSDAAIAPGVPLAPPDQPTP